VPKSAVPVKSMLGDMFASFDSIAGSSDVSPVRSGENMLMKGTAESGDWHIKFDSTGKPLAFEMPNMNLVVEFTEFIMGEAAMTTTTAAVTETPAPETVVTTAPHEALPTVPAETTLVPATTPGDNAERDNSERDNSNAVFNPVGGVDEMLKP